MTNEKQTENKLDRLTRKFLSGEQNTPEQRARFKAEREASYGTAREWAQMQENGSIAVDISQWLPDGTRGHGAYVSDPGDPNYADLCSSHNLLTPGDASTVVKKWVDGTWVVQPAEKGDLEQQKADFLRVLDEEG